MQLTKPGTTANRLLAALPDKNLEHLLASCESVDLIFADVLCRAGRSYPARLLPDRQLHLFGGSGRWLRRSGSGDGRQ